MAAIASSHDLGALPASATISFDLTLADRDPRGLAALIARGGTVSPAQFAARFGPDASAVAALTQRLRAYSLAATWQTGDTQMTVHGAAGDVMRMLGISIHQYREQNGTVFHAPAAGATVAPAQLGAEVLAVAGLDNYKRAITYALPASDTNGFTYNDAEGFYDTAPLRNAGIDGTGETVVILDWAVPSQALLQAFTQKFTPKQPLTLDVHTNSAWGAPFPTSNQQYAGAVGESALDVDVVHGIAPGAHIAFYAFSDPTQIAAVVTQATKDFPHSIISSSISDGWCEQEQGAQQSEVSLNQASTAAAAQGESIFFAAGDRGAYGCMPNYPQQDPNGNTELSVNPDTCPDGLTSVGGTTVFMGQNNTYFQEGAWGEPAESWGGGGGECKYTPRASWQTGPGVPSSSVRLAPDVSANADILTGWDIFGPGQQDPTQPQEGPTGGTSAATPFWAAVTALIDEDLTQKHLPIVGFANPALYFFGESPSGLPAPPFHDVVLGANLHYPAGPGWDFATGLGTPDVAALTDDFEWYEQSRGGGS